jgi:PAS domain-containing protein
LYSAEFPSIDSAPGSGSDLPYDALFAAATEPVLILDAWSGMIIEANPAGAQLLQTERAMLLGTSFIDMVEQSSVAAVRRSFAIARAEGRAGSINVRTRQGRSTLGLETALFHVAPASYLLLRLMRRIGTHARAAHRGADSHVLKAIERTTVGFLITDAQLRVEYVNRACVQMLGLLSADQVCGRPLASWLSLGDADLARLRGPLAERHAATVLHTSLRGAGNGTRFVEVHAVAVPAGSGTRWGITLRERPRLN